MGNITSYFFIIMMTTMLSTCGVGPPKDDKCIPSDNTSTTGAPTAAGAQTNSAGPNGANSFVEELDKQLKEGHIISSIVKDIKTKLLGTDGSFTGAQGIFNGFVTSPEFQTALGAAFSLFVIIYGLSVAVGMVQVSLGDAAIRVAKIGFIALVAMNWDIFYAYIGNFFVQGTDDLIFFFMKNFQSLYNVGGQTGSLPTVNVDSSVGIFAGYDEFIARIFSFQTFAFVSAMFHAGVYAPIYAFFIIMTLWWVLEAILKVVQVYIFSLFAKALLFAVAPMFLAFLLFEKTKQMFDAWVNQLVSYSLQPILITAYIGLFANLLMPFFDQFTQYKMCWNRLNNTSDEHGWRFVQKGSASNDPIDFGTNSAPPIGLQAVFLFMLFAWLFKSALTMTDDMVRTISQASGRLSDIEGLRKFSQGIGGTTNQGTFGNRVGNTIRNVGPQ